MTIDTVGELLARQAAEQGERTYLIAPDEGQTLSFAGLQAAARQLAGFFEQRRLPPASHVAWLLPNGPLAVQLLIGTMAAGQVATPLSLLAQAEQLAYVIEHAGCRLVFTVAEHADQVRAALAQVKHAVDLVLLDEGLPVAADGATTLAPRRDSPALLMYTSGTTGRPKGVLLTHGNVLAGARLVSEAHQLGPADRVLAVLPMYHINAQIVTALAPLWHGGSLVMPQRFSVGAFWPQAAAHACTWLNLVPTMLAYLLADPAVASVPAGLRFCRSASAPLPVQHLQAFEARFGIGVIETMGLTETAAPIFSNPLAAARRKAGSPGQAFGCEARTVDPATGAVLADGQPGEIQVRGPNVMAGYLQAPEETARAFSADGWLRTGDLGYRDADGYYFITGRLKELIIKGGENIAPREIDEVLLAHPAVLEAAVTGIPDPLYGQEILAGIVLRDGLGWDEALLSDFCRQRLGRFKTPRYFVQLDALPKGPSGKVQRLKIASTVTAMD